MNHLELDLLEHLEASDLSLRQIIVDTGFESYRSAAIVLRGMHEEGRLHFYVNATGKSEPLQHWQVEELLRSDQADKEHPRVRVSLKTEP